MLRSSATDTIPRAWISVPEAVTFAAGDRDVHAFYYPPTNPDVDGAGRHDSRRCSSSRMAGRPARRSDVLDPKMQFWTSRGFAVLDVNYSGSTGYGRPYRDRLKGQWGIVDVEDAVAGAQAMVAGGEGGSGSADHPRRQRRRLHDAGGADVPRHLQVRRELLRHQRPRSAAAGHAQVRVALQRFADRSVSGSEGDVYHARSPIHFTDRLSCPIILFQGLEDKVVPPNQSEMMAEAVRKKGLKVKYVTFEGEQHGFRKAENIIRCLEEELAFYRDVFGM